MYITEVFDVINAVSDRKFGSAFKRANNPTS